MKFNSSSDARREIQSGYENQKPANDARREILRSYEASAFGGPALAPENRVYAYITRMTPKLVSDNPQADVTHAGGHEERKTAAMMTVALNEWIVNTRHARFLERLVPYVLTGWGITLTTVEKIGGFNDTEDEVTSPNGVILDPCDVTWDPFASSFDTKRWCSHKYARDYDELVAHAKEHPEEGWDLKALESCAVDVELDLLARASTAKNVPKRREIVLNDIWCAGEPGESGYLHTLGVNKTNDGEYLRTSRKFKGPRSGPYTLWGIYSVPNRSLPLSPLGPVWPVIQELNAFALVVAEAAKKGKSIGIGSGTMTPAYITAINQARDFDSIHAQGAKPEDFNIHEFGYITKERIEYMALLSERVDRILGMDDAQRGKVTGIGTATEVATASSATNEITGYVAQRFEECAEAYLMSVLQYLYEDDTVAFDLSMKEEDRQKHGIDRLRYRGGAETPFEGYSLSITQYSMQRMSEAKMRQRSNDLIQLLPQLQLVPALSPYMDVPQYLDMIGQGIDIPDLGSLISGDKAVEVLNQQMNQEQAAAAPEPTSQAPTSQVRVPGAAA